MLINELFGRQITTQSSCQALDVPGQSNRSQRVASEEPAMKLGQAWTA